METSTKRNLRRNGGARTMVAALALATALGGMSAVIARADDRGRSEDQGHADRGRSEDQGHADRGRGEDRQGHDQRGRQRHQVVQRRDAPQHRGYVYQRPYDYDRAPPPVSYYQPQPPPAVDFVFPLYLR